MILPRSEDTLHRGQIYRLLIEIADNNVLSGSLIFKGGTCATLMGVLDRFSVDLDFDIKPNANRQDLTKELESVFNTLGLEIKDKGKEALQYYLKYPAPAGRRNTLKIDAVSNPLRNDEYKAVFLADIQRYMVCQTVETMFAHKLVAVTDRFERHNSIAGRDLYDIRYFFVNGYGYKAKIIFERTGLSAKDYLVKLKDFIEKNITETIINEDINTLLSYEKFSAIRKSLKVEVISMLKDEISRIS